MVQRSVAVRTCIGCRVRGDRGELVRLVVDDDNGTSGVVVDRQGVRPGRGAWLHPNADCVHKAVRRKAFGQAFRRGGIYVELEALVREIERGMTETR